MNKLKFKPSKNSNSVMILKIKKVPRFGLIGQRVDTAHSLIARYSRLGWIPAGKRQS